MRLSHDLLKYNAIQYNTNTEQLNLRMTAEQLLYAETLCHIFDKNVNEQYCFTTLTLSSIRHAHNTSLIINIPYSSA